ncbi:MAG: hypothetical protein ACR2NT_16335 [Acidimicrobiia bacterium]
MIDAHTSRDIDLVLAAISELPGGSILSALIPESGCSGAGVSQLSQNN